MKFMLPVTLLCATLGACAANVDTDDVDAVLELEGDADMGRTLYGDECARCHSDDGEGVNAAPFPTVVPESSDEELVENILRGPGYMPNFVNSLDSQQVADIVAHMRATW